MGRKKHKAYRKIALFLKRYVNIWSQRKLTKWLLNFPLLHIKKECRWGNGENFKYCISSCNSILFLASPQGFLLLKPTFYFILTKYKIVQKNLSFAYRKHIYRECCRIIMITVSIFILHCWTYQYSLDMLTHLNTVRYYFLQNGLQMPLILRIFKDNCNIEEENRQFHLCN